MTKKIVAIAVIALMAFGVFAFSGCDLSSDLSEYKVTAETVIQSHADTKIAENSYTEQGLEAIEKAVVDGKEAVKNATTKANVDAERDKAIGAIDIIERDICEIKVQAKQTYLDTVLKSNHPEATIADISFRPFLGIYDGSLVAVFYGGQYHGMFPENEISYELEGMVFAFSNGYPILVWNNGSICELAAAYEQRFLTKENLVTIYNLYYDIEDEEEMNMVVQVKQSYLNVFIKNKRLDATINDVVITEYLGTYGKNFVAVLNDKENLVFTDILRPYEVAGLDFSFSNGYPILVWKAGIFSSLDEAYKQGEISKSDLDAIHYLYNNKNEQQKI